jgi:hypothetical protein
MDQDESDGRSSTKKTLIIVLSVGGGLLLLCLLSCGGLGIWVYKMVGNPVQAGISAETFVANLAAGNVEAAYAMTSGGFQAKQSLEEFRALVKRYPALASSSGRTMRNMNITQTPNGPEAQVQETVSTPNSTVTLSLTLIQEDGAWKVDSFSVR